MADKDEMEAKRLSEEHDMADEPDSSPDASDASDSGT